MYEYKLVKIELKGINELKPQVDYHKIIDDHAKEGWRLLQIFSPNTKGFGLASFFELVFEKQIDK